MKKITLLFFSILFVLPCFAQVFGTVSNGEGERLPFASVYLQGTSIGTTTNDEGEYVFDLKAGQYTLVFQYIGYQQLLKNIKMQMQKIQLMLSFVKPLPSGTIIEIE